MSSTTQNEEPGKSDNGAIPSEIKCWALDTFTNNMCTREFGTVWALLKHHESAHAAQIAPFATYSPNDGSKQYLVQIVMGDSHFFVRQEKEEEGLSEYRYILVSSNIDPGVRTLNCFHNVGANTWTTVVEDNEIKISEFNPLHFILKKLRPVMVQLFNNITPIEPEEPEVSVHELAVAESNHNPNLDNRTKKRTHYVLQSLFKLSKNAGESEAFDDGVNKMTDAMWSIIFNKVLESKITTDPLQSFFLELIDTPFETNDEFVRYCDYLLTVERIKKCPNMV